MSFNSYPIVTLGSNIDLIRQGHNIITTNIGDIEGLQTSNKITVVDAVNSLKIAFDALTFSAYPPLNNEQWLVANNFVGDGTVNLFKLSSSNEFILGSHLIPFSSVTDLGKEGTDFRSIYSKTVYTEKVQVTAGTTIMDITSVNGIRINTNAGILSILETSGTLLTITADDELNIKSDLTKIYSTTNYIELEAAGHLLPGTNELQNLGSASKRVNKIYAKDLDLTGAIVVPAGTTPPVGSGLLWFGPDSSVPTNYLIAKGDVVAQATYPELFALIGSTYNTTGEGVGNFRLPDMRGMIPMGINTAQTSNPDISAPNKKIGSLNHTHSVPPHRHAVADIAVTSSGSHTHAVTDFTGARNSANAFVDFNHAHNIDHTHGHTLSLTGDTHTHTNGTLAIANGGGHSHTFTVEGSSGSGGNRRVAENYASPSGTTYSTNSVADHSHAITGNVAGYFHTHTINGSISSTIGQLSAGMNIDVNGPNDHRHAITLSGPHTHTVPGHNAGDAGSVNGDVAMTSGTNNPPCIALWFLIRAK